MRTIMVARVFLLAVVRGLLVLKIPNTPCLISPGQSLQPVVSDSAAHAGRVTIITSVFCRSRLVTTPRPTDGVDVYFEMPGDDSEHANFLRAKTDLEERRMKRINEVNFTGLRRG